MLRHCSVWQETKSQKHRFPQLDKEVTIDVAIIGGGITGLTAAIELIHQNKKICIIEAGKIGEGTTGYSTGNLYAPIQSLYSNIASKFSKEATKTIIDSRVFALKYIEQNIKKYGIDCHFLKRPLYLYTNCLKKIKLLQNEFELLKEGGLDVSITKELPLPVDFVFALKVENQARFNPNIYIDKVASLLAGNNNYQIF